MPADADRGAPAAGAGATGPAPASDAGATAPALAAGDRCLLLVMRPNDERARVFSSLAGLGYQVVLASDALEIPAALDVGRPDFALIFEDPGSPAAIEALRRMAPAIPVLLLPTRVASTADEPSRARSIAAALAEAQRLATSSVVPVRGPRRRLPLDPFVGTSEAILQLTEEARIALASESPMLIEGETGSGKGVLAEWLHRHGPRGQHPFIDLNCAGFSRELMESELFGHERGAFTGAVSSKPGLLEVADGGTLFLDEIGDMDAPIQAKLLKVIEEKRFRRIGETRERSANVRIIAATHHDLLQLVSESRFREDLYYRIGVLSLRVPPLRRRREDLAVLVATILRTLAHDLGRDTPTISPATSRILLERAWPGNLRELRNTLERALLAAEAGPIEPHHLGPSDSRPVRAEPKPQDGTLHDVERAYIERVLEEEQHVERAALRLGMARSTLYQKLRALGIKLTR